MSSGSGDALILQWKYVSEVECALSFCPTVKSESRRSALTSLMGHVSGDGCGRSPSGMARYVVLAQRPQFPRMARRCSLWSFRIDSGDGTRIL